MKFFPNKFQITKRDILIAILSVVGTLIVQVSVFTINKYIETKWFKDNKQDFTLTDSINYYPLSQGNTWVYSGTIEGQIGDVSGKTASKTFDDYTISVERVINKGGFRAALIKESYSLVDLLDDIKEEREELWILVGGKLYAVTDKDKISLYLRDLDKTDPYIEDFKYDDLAWDFPLFVGKKYDFLDMFVDGGSRYSYNITDKQKISISGIIDNKECYKREMLTNPDESYSWFCPGVGVVEESYIHNGTVLNFSYKLKNFYVK